MENTTFETNTAAGSKPSWFNNALMYGIYTGIASIILSLLFFAFDVSKTSWINYLSTLVLIAGIVMATMHYRDKINGGLVTYGKAFLTGLIVSVVVGVISALYIYVHYGFIDVNGLDEIAAMSEQQMLDMGMSDEMIDKQMAMSSKFMEMPIMNIMALVGTVTWGVIISLITSAILKKNDDSFKATFNQ